MDDFGHLELAFGIHVAELSAGDRIAAADEHGHEIAIEHALHEPPIGTVLLFLNSHVHLSLRQRTAVYGGHRLPQNGDQDFLRASLPELFI